MSKRKQRNIKKSAGIALFRVHPGDGAIDSGPHLKILLVKKRFTYSFSDFVHGKYSKKSIGCLMNMFAKMTTDEILEVWSLKFERMWNKIWSDAEMSSDNFRRKNAKFSSTFLLRDGGSNLHKMLSDVKCRGVIPWEIPKGRRKTQRETEIDCAVRELYEETGFERSKYHLFPGFSKTVSYEQGGTRYVNTYYPALMNHTSNHRSGRAGRVSIPIKKLEQINEVSEVRWIPMGEIHFVDDERRHLRKTLSPLVRYVKAFVNGKPSRNVRHAAFVR